MSDQNRVNLEKLTAIIRKSEKEYVGVCLEVNVAAQGKTIPEVESNLIVAVNEYNTPQKLDNPLRWISTCWSDILTTAEAQRAQRSIEANRHASQQRRKSFRQEENSMNQRKQYDARFKAQVALEAVLEQQTMAQIASE